VSWNLNRATWSSRGRCLSAVEHADRAWSELAGLEADVALMQEAPPPPEGLDRPPLMTLPEGTADEAWRSLPGPRRWWCSAIASWGPGLEPIDSSGREPLVESDQGAYRIGVVPWNRRALTVVSIYALWDYSWLEGSAKPVYSETSLHRALSDLTPILDVTRSRSAGSVLIAGDFNASTQFDEPYRSAYRVVHDRLASLGLTNVTVRAEREQLEGCPCEDDPCRHVRTLEGAVPYQDDYIHASPDVAEAIRCIATERTPGIEAASDHLPLVVEIG
jgi:hypothetical protein